MPDRFTQRNKNTYVHLFTTFEIRINVCNYFAFTSFVLLFNTDTKIQNFFWCAKKWPSYVTFCLMYTNNMVEKQMNCLLKKFNSQNISISEIPINPIFNFAFFYCLHSPHNVLLLLYVTSNRNQSYDLLKSI